MKNFVGILNNVRIIQNSPVLIRFMLETVSGSIHCFVPDCNLASEMLLIPNGIYIISACGYLNSRNQLILTSFSMISPDASSNISTEKCSCQSKMQPQRDGEGQEVIP